MNTTCLSEHFNQTLVSSPAETINMFANQGCNCSDIIPALSTTNISFYIDCGTFPFEHNWWIQVVYFILFGALILISVSGNLVVIWIVLAHRCMRTVTNYFLLNLAIADCSITLLNVCFAFTLNFYVKWFFGKTYCYIFNFMGVTPTCASVFTLIAMSLNRYNVVVHPLRPLWSEPLTISCIVAIWTFAVLCGLPNLLATRYVSIYYFNGGDVLTQHYCLADDYPDGINFESKLYKAYQHFLLLINYILPLVILSVAFIRIAMVLWGADSIGENRHDLLIKRKRKVVKMLIVVVSLFMICWMPYHIYFTFLSSVLDQSVGPIWSMWIYLHIYWLAMSSTMVNPIIYCWLNERFRIGFKYVFRALPCIHMDTMEYYRSDLCRDPRQKPSSSQTLLRQAYRSTNEYSLASHPAPNRRRTPGISRAHTIMVDTMIKSQSQCSTPVLTRSRTVHEDTLISSV